jgi:hypothetical protein
VGRRSHVATGRDGDHLIGSEYRGNRVGEGDVSDILTLSSASTAMLVLIERPLWAIIVFLKHS